MKVVENIIRAIAESEVNIFTKAEIIKLIKRETDIKVMPEIKFWQTQNGKIISHGIHEHNGGLGLIVNNLELLKRYLQEEPLNKENIEYCIHRINTGKEKCMEGIDYIYTKFEEMYKNKLNNE